MRQNTTAKRRRLAAWGAMLTLISGCAGPAFDSAPATPQSYGASQPLLHHRSKGIEIEWQGFRAAGHASGPEAIRWLEHRLQVVNRGSRPVTVDTVKLLTTQGRYFDSASGYDQIRRRPDPGDQIAENIATTTAGIAVGQVIPYGGAIVGILTSAALAGTSEQEAAARTAFDLKVIEGAELAPGGRIQGSAFLPDIEDASSLVVIWSDGTTQHRAELPYPAATNR